MATARILATNDHYHTLEIDAGGFIFTQTIIAQETGAALDALIASYAAEYEAALAELMQG